MITIKDVALSAGVSIATVSRVLNNRGSLSEKTKAKVFQAMKDLDYQPNEVARTLSKQSSKIFGLIIPSMTHPFYATLSSSIEHYGFQKGYKLMICNSSFETRKEQIYLEMLRRNMVDGIIIASHNSDNAELFGNVRMPVISAEQILSQDIPAVVSDNYNGGYKATMHLIEKGCKVLAHVSGDLSLHLSSDERYKAFVDACTDNNVAYYLYEATEKMLIDLDYTKLVNRMLDEHPNIEGIFASSDVIAMEAIKTCIIRGYKIPEQVKIVGFDDVYIGSLFYPEITSVKQDVDTLGKRIVDNLIDLINHKQVEMKSVVPVQFVKRSTT